MSCGAPASLFSRSLWLMRKTSTSLWVRSSSDRSPDSSVMDGRTVTGGTGNAVSTIHSGRQALGSMPSGTRSASGMRSRRSLTSFGVSLWPSSRKVVGLSRVIFSCSTPQWGQTSLVAFSAAAFAVSLANSRRSMASLPSSSMVSRRAWYSLTSSSVRTRRPHDLHVACRSFLISLT
ncbi:MAG: hypothetical protein A4E30_01612 [Methanomassiliicoccales archaeon PtaB.Bin215]|nr:MAG: hypothetical protein A4E30_01612 [Methanomassiliicoccales archaeon PtaB.Bin215]